MAAQGFCGCGLVAIAKGIHYQPVLITRCIMSVVKRQPLIAGGMQPELVNQLESSRGTSQFIDRKVKLAVQGDNRRVVALGMALLGFTKIVQEHVDLLLIAA